MRITHIDLLARNTRLLPATAHLRLIQIARSSIYMAIFRAQRMVYRVLDFMGFGELRMVSFAPELVS